MYETGPTVLWKDMSVLQAVDGDHWETGPWIRAWRAHPSRPSPGGGGRPRPRRLRARLATPLVVAEAGRPVEVTVQVSSSAWFVDDVRVEVLGAASGWSSVDHEVLGLLPAEERSLTVTLSPPPLTTLQRVDIAFAVRVTSEAPPHDSAIAAGVIRVGSGARHQ